MTIGGALALIAVGAILAFALEVEELAGIDIQVIGVIFMVVGLIALVIGLVLLQRGVGPRQRPPY